MSKNMFYVLGLVADGKMIDEGCKMKSDYGGRASTIKALDLRGLIGLYGYEPPGVNIEERERGWRITEKGQAILDEYRKSK